MDSIASLLENIVIIGVPAVLAITLHEASHGYAALACGDPTARDANRLTLNPLRHIDPFGTVILPGMLALAGGPVLGWAKPVPVDFRRLRHPRRDSVLVAGAGPATNIVLAVVSALLFHLLPEQPTAAAILAGKLLQMSVMINVVLAIFNMLPIPPLDGGRVAVGLLPLALARPLARLEKYGMVILLALLIGLPWLGELVGRDLNLFARAMDPIFSSVVRAIAALTGLI